jgi:epoxyqueuosine reductase
MKRYDWLALKEELKTFAKENGIDQIGIASADPFLELKDRLVQHREKGFESGFEESDLYKRTHPDALLPEARSIIAIALAYPTKLINPPKSEPGAYRGILSRSAWGQDYHHILADRLQKLEHFLQARVPEVKLQYMVDTGALSDRAVAERAGIGFTGKNSSVISQELGSWMYLGEMITNLPLPPDHPVEDSCGDCTLCIDACPTGALVGPGQLNAQRCISFLTQTKGFLDDEFKKKIGNRLYGCDTCQIVCPKNKGKHFVHHAEMMPDPEVVKPLLKPLLFIGKKEFKERFGQSAASWRGKKPIQRNAVIALGNFKDTSAVSDLIEVLLHDPRPELRESAAWSLGEIGTPSTAEGIEAALGKETHPVVMEQLRRVSNRIQSKESSKAPVS